MPKRLRALVLSCALITAMAGCSDAPVDVSVEATRLGTTLAYEAPAAGFGYPQSEQTLARYVAQGDVVSMRAHAWSDWAALTAPSASGVPIMLTWYQNREVFGQGDIDQPRTFLPQFLTGGRDSLGEANPLISFNVYNQGYRDHVRAHGYQWRDTLIGLVGKQPVVVDFPPDAITVKTVWWPVRHDGLTAFPVWDGEPTRPIEWGLGIDLLADQGFFGVLTPAQRAELVSHAKHGNEWGTFRRIIVIDPGRTTVPTHETTAITFFDPNALSLQGDTVRVARVVPLTDFLHVRANDAAMLDRLNQGLTGQLAERFWGRPVNADDYLALVAVHISTREAPDWVWATFWWHDEPHAAPFGHDRPFVVQPPFDRLRMQVAQSADVPQAGDGGPHIAYNPYLEAGFALGVKSNCLACHQRAVRTADGPGEVYPVMRGSMRLDDPFFSGKLRTHFLWSLVFRPRPALLLELSEPTDCQTPPPGRC